MPPVNILYDSTTGRILSANLAVITPVPAGHLTTLKTLANLTDLFEKRIDPTPIDLLDKNFIQLDSAPTVPAATVQTIVFTKRDGETQELLDDPSDNDTILVSARKADLTFDEADRRVFFDVLQTALVEGAGQVKGAVGLAPGSETIVFFNDTLTPLFQKFNYV